MGPTFTGVAIALLVLAAVLWPLERAWPAVPGQRWRRPGLGTDLAYWFFTPLVTKALTRAAVVVAVVIAAVAAGLPLEKSAIEAWLADPTRAVRRQPAWLQVLEVLLIGDLVGYWTHRLFHGRRLWRFHAVHHASRHLDWLSSVRLHPVNDAVARMSGVVPILLLGFPPTVLAAYVPFLTLWAILLHANLRWTFGPLRYVIASPTFHRWHHTSEDEGLDKNFAGLFPFIDLAFGTFHMPEGRQPVRFGLKDEQVPEGLLGQIAYPFGSSRGTSFAVGSEPLEAVIAVCPITLFVPGQEPREYRIQLNDSQRRDTWCQVYSANGTLVRMHTSPGGTWGFSGSLAYPLSWPETGLVEASVHCLLLPGASLERIEIVWYQP